MVHETRAGSHLGTRRCRRNTFGFECSIGVGNSRSILAGLALATFFFGFMLSSRTTAALRRKAYARYRESNATYTFSDRGILATSRYAQGSFVWAAMDRVIETKGLFLLCVGNSYICVPKRDIPPNSFSDFTQMLGAHHGAKVRKGM